MSLKQWLRKGDKAQGRGSISTLGGSHQTSRSRRIMASFRGGTKVGSVGGSGQTQPGSSARRPYAWLVLAVVLSLALTTVWYRESPTGPLHTVRAAVQTVTTPIGAAGTGATAPVRKFILWVGDLGVTRSELQALRDQNDELRARVVTLEESRLENSRFRALVGESEETSMSAGQSGLAATVIGRPDTSYSQVITLSKGKTSGVILNLPVVTGRGLLGQVIEVGPNYSKVRLITDPSSGVAALVQRNRYPGVLRGSLTGELTLDFIATDAEINPGDIVLTSGLGGIYPKGLVIGEIVDSSDAINTLYKTIKVRPMNTVEALEEVLILMDAPPSLDALPPRELPPPEAAD